MMSVHFKRAAAAVLAGMTLLAGQSFPVNADGDAPKKIVVIGDGISSGAQLSDRSRSYAGLVARYYGAEVTDLSKDACTTEEMLAELDDPAVQAALAEADMILFTIGIQDITDPFFEQLTVYQEELGFHDISEMYDMKRSDIALSDDTLTGYSLELKNKLESNEISCRDNVLKIGEKLAAYSDAEIICPNVYNCLNCIENLSSLSIKRQQAYKSVMNPGGWVLTDSVNVSYDTLAKDYGFTVIDTYNGFLGLAYKYTNLLEMDENPTAEGHLWIAQQITGSSLEELMTEVPTTEEPTTEVPTTEEPTTEVPTTEEPTTEVPATEPVTEDPTEPVTDPVNTVVLGDVSGDGEVTADDAAEVLIAAAKIGAGQKELLTAELLACADVNKDGDVGASDAASILQYAAATGAGDKITPEDFFAREQA